MNRYNKNMRLLLVALLFIGCAIQNPGIKDVKGNWESTSLLYQRIEIDDSGKGYFAIGLTGLNNKIEYCAIKRVSFTENKLALYLTCDKSSHPEIVAEGYVTKSAIVIERYVQNGKTKELKAPVYYLLEGLVESTRKAVKEKISKLRKKDS